MVTKNPSELLVSACGSLATCQDMERYKIESVKQSFQLSHVTLKMVKCPENTLIVTREIQVHN
jgi:hypothetical protein